MNPDPHQTIVKWRSGASSIPTTNISRVTADPDTRSAVSRALGGFWGMYLLTFAGMLAFMFMLAVFVTMFSKIMSMLNK